MRLSVIISLALAAITSEVSAMPHAGYTWHGPGSWRSWTTLPWAKGAVWIDLHTGASGCTGGWWNYCVYGKLDTSYNVPGSTAWYDVYGNRHEWSSSSGQPYTPAPNEPYQPGTQQGGPQQGGPQQGGTTPTQTNTTYTDNSPSGESPSPSPSPSGQYNPESYSS